MKNIFVGNLDFAATDADRAFQALNGTEFNGRALILNEARPKPAGGGGDGPFRGNRRGGPPRQRREPRW